MLMRAAALYCRAAESKGAALREQYERDGVVMIRQAVTADQIAGLKIALEEVFLREDFGSKGGRTNMSTAAAEAAEGGTVLLEDEAEDDSAPVGEYLTETNVGRFHHGVREFEHESDLAAVVGPMLGTKTLRFFGDHCFLKEPNSALRTSFHRERVFLLPFTRLLPPPLPPLLTAVCRCAEDMPYFTWSGDQAAVCWVPVDTVTKASGAMRYVKGSHRWDQFAPRLLYSNEAVDDGAAEYSPILPSDEEIYAEHEVLQWDCEPGDVIVHHPNMVHGSEGNTTAGRRRLAASVRYVGDDCVWDMKPTAKGLVDGDLSGKWHFTSDGSESASLFAKASEDFAALSADEMYEVSPTLCHFEMKDGINFGATALSNLAFPVVWVDRSAKL